MKKTKIIVPAIAALVLGLGAAVTGTVAWYQSVASTSIAADSVSLGALSVEKTQSSLSYEATMHIVFGNPSNSSIQLTAWGTGGNASNLYTAVVPSNVSDNSSPTFTQVNVADETMIIEVKAYLTDTSTNQSEEGHAAAWEAGIDALNSEDATKTLSFSYDQDDSTGSLFLDSEVFFYTSGYSTNAAAAYDKSSEHVSGSGTQNISINAQALKANDHYVTTAQTAVRVGWLYVRFDGSIRQHDNSKTYTATLVSSLA